MGKEHTGKHSYPIALLLSTNSAKTDGAVGTKLKPGVKYDRVTASSALSPAVPYSPSAVARRREGGGAVGGMGLRGGGSVVPSAL